MAMFFNRSMASVAELGCSTCKANACHARRALAATVGWGWKTMW